MPEKITEKERQRVKQAKTAALARDVSLDPPKDLKRRRACLDDPLEFMRTYFGWIFWQPFTEARKTMVDSIIHAARYSGDYAVADKRGGGKTGIALFTTFWLDLRNECQLPIIIGKNQAGAENELYNLKQAITESPDFSDDFPEICTPIIALDDWASNARKQTVNGYRTKIGWQKDCLFLPTVPQDALPPKWPMSEESVACGQGLAVVGIGGKIRGFKRRNIRPGLALIDDIDDRESARSDTQIEDYRVAIDQDIAGLAGSGKRISRVMLCTTLNNKCIAWVYTGMAGWRGQRFKAITKMPERTDLRDEYIELRKHRSRDDPDARVAHRFYLENLEEIERGGEVENPHDCVSKPGLDGEPLEVSALQHYFNCIADIDWKPFLCEYQNDPPADDEDKLILTAYHIQENCRSGFKRRTVPDDTVAITVGVDVQKLGLHYVVIAWTATGAGYIIDYDFFEFMTAGKKAADCEVLILEGLFDWHKMMQDNPYHSEPSDEFPADGEPHFADVTLIDMGWKEETWNTQPVQVFCQQVGIDKFRPSKGQPNYRRPKARSVKCGDNWHFDRIGRTRVVIMNADHWKLKVHEGFLADNGEPGSLRIFEKPEANGRVSRNFHLSYAKHILAEVWDMLKMCFSKPTKPNHWFDATYQAIVGRSICGIHVVPQDTGPPVPPPNQRPTAAQLAARK